MEELAEISINLICPLHSSEDYSSFLKLRLFYEVIDFCSLHLKNSQTESFPRARTHDLKVGAKVAHLCEGIRDEAV